MLARIALSEKLKAAIVIDSFFVDSDDFFLSLPQAAATRARATARAGTARRARCLRMYACLLGDVMSPRPLWPRRRRAHSCPDDGGSSQPRPQTAGRGR